MTLMMTDVPAAMWPTGLLLRLGTHFQDVSLGIDQSLTPVIATAVRKRDGTEHTFVVGEVASEPWRELV